MSKVLKARIDQQIQGLQVFAKASANPHGILGIVGVLEAAKARIEFMEKVIDQRLPSEAEIALQLLPALITSNPERPEDAVVCDAFSWARTYHQIKETRE